MNADTYYDPSYGVDEWEADLECEVCGKDTEHYFRKQWGLVTAVCTACENETEIEE